jgi:hypothetical protein
MVHALIRQSKVLLGGLERTETSVVVGEVEVERRIEPGDSETRVVLQLSWVRCTRARTSPHEMANVLAS